MTRSQIKSMSSEAAPPGSSSWSRLPSLTALRFFAAFLVFIYHTSLAHGPIPPFGAINFFADHSIANGYAAVMEKGGYIGVSFFFVLSGFVLTYSSKRRDTARAFWRRRAVKVFPNHWVMFGVAMLCFAAAITRWQAWLPNIFLVHSFFPAADTFASVNPPSWTLCSELLFYALFPLLIRPIRRLKDSQLVLGCVAMVIGMLAVAAINQWCIPSTPVSPYLTRVSIPQQWFGYIFPPVRLFEFVLGMLVARLVLSGSFPRIGVVPAVVLLIGSYAGALFSPYLLTFNVITVVPIALLIGAAARSDLDGRRSAFRHPAMVRLGEISFAFYMTQGVVLFWGRSMVTDNHVFGVVPAIGLILAFTAANLAAGWLLWRFVETPMMNRFATSRRSRAARNSDRPAAAIRPDRSAAEDQATSEQAAVGV